VTVDPLLLHLVEAASSLLLRTGSHLTKRAIGAKTPLCYQAGEEQEETVGAKRAMLFS
jgi:hypothetical protein